MLLKTSDDYDDDDDDNVFLTCLIGWLALAFRDNHDLRWLKAFSENMKQKYG